MLTWIYLFIAGLLEVFWATTMKLSHGFTDLKYTILTIVGSLLSFGLLGIAMKKIPVGLAYPIWTGIGAVGSIIIGVVFFRDKIAPVTWIFVGLLVIGLIGIEVTSNH